MGRMIIFDLGCENGHRFEGWFSSSEDYERQRSERMLACPVCGDANVVRLPNASRLNLGRGERARGEATREARQHYTNLGSELLERLIDYVIENTEDVGPAFPEEARKIHYREAPERRIRGTATRDEVEALQEEGIEVVALPIPAHRLVKTH